jgi:hypothetical protein
MNNREQYEKIKDFAVSLLRHTHKYVAPHILLEQEKRSYALGSARVSLIIKDSRNIDQAIHGVDNLLKQANKHHDNFFSMIKKYYYYRLSLLHAKDILLSMKTRYIVGYSDYILD